MVVINPGRGPGLWPGQVAADSGSSIIDTMEPAKQVSRAILICRPNSHPFQERQLLLDKPEKIGRSVARVRAAPNNAIFDCKVLSRNHALLWFENGKFFLQDTKSSNGTFVNSQRLGKGANESPPRELCSGDIVQFGVDVMENSKQVTHGCIVATLKLYLPDGKEAKPSAATIPLSPACPVQLPELYQLQQCVQEAVQREQAVETKLATLQRLLDGVQAATSSGWKALIDEDRLLTRLEILEGQHAHYSKNFGDDKLREEIARLQEEKNTYQNVAKESLKKVLQEKLEAVRKLQELERTVVAAEEECRCQTELREAANRELADLAAKYEAKLSAVTDLENKIKELEEEQAAAAESWEAERARVQLRAAQQRGEEAQQRARMEGLQAESDFCKQQLAALRQKLQTKLSVETTPNGDIALESGGMVQTEQELAAVRSQLTAAEAQLTAATQTIGRLREDIGRAEAEAGQHRERAAELEQDLQQAKADAAERREEAQRVEEGLKEKEAELLKLEKQRSAGDTDIKENETDILHLRNKVQSLQELLGEATQARTDAEARVERFESELLVTRNNGQDATLRAEHLRAQLKEAESSLTVRAERTEQLQQTVVRLAASVTEAVGQLHALQQRYDQKQRAVEEGIAQAEKLQESLTAAEQRVAESSGESDSLRAQLGELRTEMEAARADAEQRQRRLDSAAESLRRLEDRCKSCEAERDAAQARCLSLESAAAEAAAAAAQAEAEAPAVPQEAPDDPEKEELRRQLRRMDEQLKELAVQNRTATACSVLPLLILAWSICLAFYDWLASLTATREP